VKGRPRSWLLPHDQLATADRERRAELVAPAHDLLDRLLVPARLRDIGLIVLVVAHQRERDLDERGVVEGEAGQQADPVTVGAAAVSRVERAAAEAVEDRLVPLHLDRAGVVPSLIPI